MTRRVSVVIPAYNEAGRVGETVLAVRRGLSTVPELQPEVLVVDDGSPDATAAEAEAAGARVLRLPKNQGKGGALTTGFKQATGDLLVMLDADLRHSAEELPKLLAPVLEGLADITVATFPRMTNRPAGFGLVLRLARWGLHRAGSVPMQAPLSGQRAFTREAWEQIGRLDRDFGVEMGLNLDAARLGLRVLEVPTTMTHRATGRNWAGFRHRGRQFLYVALAILRRW